MAIVYFDSSALVKLLVEEVGSTVSAALWDGADAVITSGLAYPEVRAALAAAHRSDRISQQSLAKAKAAWERFWEALGTVELNRALLESAGNVAEHHHLRGYDAVHLSSALTVEKSNLVMAVWAVRLRKAAVESGLSVAPIHV